ncbi:MAG: endolytic transglycosylase MltG [Bacteriovoracaceae bacterium]
MKRAFLLSTLLAPLFAAIFLGIHFSIIFFSPYQGEEVTFTVKPGEGFASVNGRLANQDLVSDPRIFHYYAKYTDKMGKIKAGTYQIRPGQNMGDVLDTLVDGVPMLSSVTLPEGKNLYEVGKILEANDIVSYKDFIKEAKKNKYMKELGIEAPSLEGYLFPDTYNFAPQSPAPTVVKTMLRLFRDKTAGLDFGKSALSKHEVVILASIVEKETGAKFERDTIAGVYLNRLKKGMRLQADPTTIYGIWEIYQGNLRKKHLQEKTPYNTYRIPGLPLGPIANPSLAAIKAVLNPEDHNYIFFVSKNDGTHVFTSTYKEHLKAVEFWQKTPENRRGKSWRDLNQD